MGWVTIKGVHVFIDDSGTITKGPARMLGKNKSDYRPKKVVAKERPAGKLTRSERRKYDTIEDALGEPFDPALLPKIKKDWNAFYKNPATYKGSVVTDMVNQYVDEHSIPARWDSKKV